MSPYNLQIVPCCSNCVTNRVKEQKCRGMSLGRSSHTFITAALSFILLIRSSTCQSLSSFFKFQIDLFILSKDIVGKTLWTQLIKKCSLEPSNEKLNRRHGGLKYKQLWANKMEWGLNFAPTVISCQHDKNPLKAVVQSAHKKTCNLQV